MERSLPLAAEAVWSTHSNETATEERRKRPARLRFGGAESAARRRKQSEIPSAPRSREAATREACDRASNRDGFAPSERGNRGN